MKKISLLVAFLWLGIMGASAQNHKYDLNGDGSVNITDVIELMNCILGLDDENENGTTSVPGEAFDLGLPSGTKWASWNVGASKPEEYGAYYAWGEIEKKEYYGQGTYKYYQNGSYVDIGSDISGTQYDVAHVKWGGNWCMPTRDDFQELLDNCTSEWTTLNSVNGVKFTSNINGNSIFLPATSYREECCLHKLGLCSEYWSSTLHSTLYASSNKTQTYTRSLFNGLTVRPVYKE